MPRIGCSGVHGSGKSTASSLLAPHIDHDLIVEKVTGTAVTLGYGNAAGVPIEDRAYFQWELVAAQSAAEANRAHFITDRTYLDFAGYWKLFYDILIEKGADDPAYRWHNKLTAGEIYAFFELDTGWNSYRQLTRRYSLMNYDVIFLFPKNHEGAVENGKRFTWMVDEYDAIIRQLIKDWGLDAKVYELQSDGPENRVAEMKEVLKGLHLL